MQHPFLLIVYGNTQNAGNHLINITSAANIGNFKLIGQPGPDCILGGNLVVNDVSFINPGKLLLGDHDLEINGNISNYSPANYFVTNGLGKLRLNNIGNSKTVFPVGPSASSYNPATLTNVGTPGDFMINVQPRVLSAGITGSPYIAGVVNRTWNIDEPAPGAGNVTVTVQWNAADELSGFSGSTSYLSHYTSGAWNNGTQMPATGSDPYSLTRTNITSFSPFAVMGPAVVLPVSLLYFSGRYKDKAITLSWSTETGLNTSYFTVEKRIDPVFFKPLTNIAAYINSQGKKNYRYVDNSFVNPVNYYRLKMVDVEGRYTYSKTIAVSAPTDHAVVVYPNPVKDELFIRLPDGMLEATLRILGAKGNTIRILTLKAGNAATSINTSGFPAGVYSIIFDSGKLKEARQFIKQ